MFHLLIQIGKEVKGITTMRTICIDMTHDLTYDDLGAYNMIYKYLIKYITLFSIQLSFFGSSKYNNQISKLAHDDSYSK